MNIWEAGITEPLLKYMKNPADVPAIQSIYECFAKDEKSVQAFEKRLLAHNEFRSLFEKWYTPEKFTMEQLLALPEDSFGYMYAAHMKRNGLQLDFISPIEGKSISSYLWLRAGHVHDICHTVLDYDTTLVGESGLKGFEIAQTGSPPSTCIMGSALVGISSSHPELIGPMLDAFVEGYERGKHYPLMMAIKWDQEWATPMTELKRKYDLA